MKYRVREVLRQSLNLENIPVNSTNYNFDSIDRYGWATLLTEDKNRVPEYKLYLDSNPKMKFEIITGYPGNKEILKVIQLKKEEMTGLRKDVIRQLMISDFKLYYSKEVYEKLGKRDKLDLFAERPNELYKELGKIPSLSRLNLRYLSVNNPKFIIDNFDEIKDNMKTDSEFWYNMIKKDKRFKDLFIHYTHTLDTKTSLRRIIRSYPTLIKQLTIDIMENSVLTKKEWALLVTDILNRKDNSVKITKEFGDWKIHEDLYEEIKLGLSVEILSGQSKLSKRLSNSLSKIKSDVEKVDDNLEDEKLKEESEIKNEI